MGIVYLAMLQGPSGFSKLLVVKELQPELVEEPAFLQMFLEEQRLLRSPLKLLALHGFMGSAAQLRAQMAVLQLDAELIAIDAPSLARGGKGWWNADEDLRYRGWSETRALIESLPPFDGVFGFSQGAVLASLVAGIMSHKPVKFAIMVGGFPSRDPRHAEIYGNGYAIPSLHIIGRRDGVVPPERSRLLAAKFDRPTIFEHDGGHVIPATAAVAAFLTTFR